MKIQRKIFSFILAILLGISMLGGDFGFAPTSAKAKKPGRVKITYLKQVRNTTKVTIKWKKTKRTSGYYIYQKTGKSKKAKFKRIKIIKKRKTTSLTTKALKVNAFYSYRIKAYRKIGKKKLFGKYSKIKTLKIKVIKPATPVVKVVKSWNIGCADDADEVYNEKTARSNVKAALLSNGTLIISGKGNAQHGRPYSGTDYFMPWYYNYRLKIKKVEIHKDVRPKSLKGWFMRCKNLVTAPKIPSSVKDMSYTFENCDSLTGKLIVEATLPDDYDYCEGCLFEASIKPDAELTVECKDDTTLDNLLTTARLIEENIHGPKKEEWNIGCGDNVDEIYNPATAKNNVKAIYYRGGFLSIEGKGNTQHAGTDIDKNMPWHDAYASQIRKVKLRKGVMPKSLLYFFYECKKLKRASAIPDSVTDMTGTFAVCSALEEPPTIPRNVKNIAYTFVQCSLLTGTLRIEANIPDDIENYEKCLRDAATEEDCCVHVDYKHLSTWEKLKTTFDGNSNIFQGNQI